MNLNDPTSKKFECEVIPGGQQTIGNMYPVDLPTQLANVNMMNGIRSSIRSETSIDTAMSLNDVESAMDDDDDAEADADDDELDQDEEMIRFTQPIFENPIALLNFDVNVQEFLDSKRISDAVRLVTKNFPELPSKKRVAYVNAVDLPDAKKVDISKKRNRENAALTRKRQRIYADFLDKAIQELTIILHGVQEGATTDNSGVPTPTGSGDGEFKLA